jgi:hypothetical protein
VHETTGVVFAQYRSLILPLSINGISIMYDGGREITSGLPSSSVSPCRACLFNAGNVLSGKPLKEPDCYFHQFDSGDVEDMLKSNSLAYTFIERIVGLLPSWLSISVPNNATDVTSFYDIDITTALVKQEDVAGISGCESITTDSQGLYMVLRYGKGFTVSDGGDPVEYSPRAPTNSNPVCVAINLCQEIESPIYVGLPSTVQSIFRSLPVLVPFSRDRWQYTIDSATLYNQGREVTIPDMYWNGTEMYSPEPFTSSLRMKTTAAINVDSLQNGQISIQVSHAGQVSSFPMNDQVKKFFSLFMNDLICIM